MTNIFTPYNKLAAAIIKQMVEERGFKYYEDGIWMLRPVNNKLVLDAASKEYLMRSHNRDIREVPIHEFIYEIGNIPIPTKEIQVDGLPWKTVIKGDVCDIGCKTDIHVGDLLKFIDSVYNKFGSDTFWGVEFKFGKNGIVIDGMYAGWNLFNDYVTIFKNALKK